VVDLDRRVARDVPLVFLAELLVAELVGGDRL
jgi:hypothetical protein